VRSGELQPDQRSRRHASDRPRVHEPPLGQLVPADDQASFDVELDRGDPGAALDQIAESIGVTRGRSLTATSDRPEVRRGDIQLFIHRDVPAIADYHLDLDLITSLTTGSSSPRARTDATSTLTAAPTHSPQRLARR
jgi:hypothetical protein